ncbi:MAG: hypothetical protein GTO45_39815 [Candidatus Aminicenantes bacterium]|nr:hypothetical protein [Candidatus Aminicenantes bacterium]NIN24267.1 hypothetical protein [Candidatus Aminicenantes bacterium]NIN48028.1 hypothetical protein [Candidatus Aminicenantes bacterium]NIN90930.1 hypothetical protein [Candidatus Aminicenantes bacterium]NIO87667.1 hypothetical protein [Candidatus Aminicenantes bacterium]
MFWVTIYLSAVKPLIKFKWLLPQLLNDVINSKEPNNSEYKKHLFSAGPQNKGQCSILKSQYPVISEIRHCSLFSGGTVLSQGAWHKAGWLLAVCSWQFAVRFELLVGFLPDFEFSCVYPIGIEHGHGAFSTPYAPCSTLFGPGRFFISNKWVSPGRGKKRSR